MPSTHNRLSRLLCACYASTPSDHPRKTPRGVVADPTIVNEDTQKQQQKTDSRLENEPYTRVEPTTKLTVHEEVAKSRSPPKPERPPPPKELTIDQRNRSEFMNRPLTGVTDRSNDAKKRDEITSQAPPSNMTMIAAVPHSYDSGRNNHHHNNNNHFCIRDVTDDPNEYDNNYGGDDEEEEGSLVEYCRLDKDKSNRSPHPKIETAAVKVTAPPQDPPQAGFWYQNALSGRAVTKIVDTAEGRCNGADCKCPGFRAHAWRKVCVHCKCDRSEHDVVTNQAATVYERIGIKPPTTGNNAMTAVVSQRSEGTPGSVSHGYAWVPPGLTRKKVEEYMSALPNHVVPRVHSQGEKYRERQLVLQLPRQDLAAAYCKHLGTPVERKVFEEFVNARNEIALDIGYVSAIIPHAMECQKCSGVMEKGDMAVMAPKLGDNAGWHPACFICSTCDQLLIDLTYCVRDGLIYCERHYAELHKPRCSACDELIFAGEYTKAMNKDWHSEHFCCWQCDTTLTGQRYILRDDHPYCIKCYEDVFANQCDECQKAIGIDSKDLSYKDKHWHEDCFLCNMCKISLVDKPFGSKNDRIFCSNCYDQAFATRCDGCNEIFRAGMKKMEYKGKQWHDKCFCCAHCKAPIGTKSFIPKNEDVFCAGCYEEKFATRCTKCKKVITTGGVTYKNEPWHRECFCCTNCHQSLAGQRFTSKDENPYCANCYGDLFAKRCNACVKPITGIGGAKFISFEDRHWHNDCFICAQCSTSLVGKGFITDGADILCPECAKARLMASNN